MASADPDADERRPLSLLFVYTWDLVRAILAGFGAIAVFGGSREVRGQIESVPVVVQIFQALAYASVAAALILVGTLLTRRARWVRRAQLVLYGMDVALIGVSLTVSLVTDESSRNAGIILFSAAFALVDLLGIVAMTERHVTEWFRDAGEVPFYIGALIAFWAAASTAFFTLGLVTQ